MTLEHLKIAAEANVVPGEDLFVNSDRSEQWE